MSRRAIYITGATVYVAIMAFVLFTGDARTRRVRAPDQYAGGGGDDAAVGGATSTNKEGLPYRSVGIQIQRTDWMNEYKQSIDKVAAIGADTVLLIVDTRTENGSSARIYLDMRMTPSVEQLGGLIDHAKGRGLRVMVMPIVLLDAPRGEEWRGRIEPATDNGGWEAWFQSYREMISFFAMTAEEHHADVLVVGSELVSSEKHATEWDKTIAAVRTIFHGKLTYSSNWDHYLNIPFWNKLDLVGMNSYWKMGADAKVTVPEIEERWHEIQTELFGFLNRVHKPLMFTEVGWCSMANMAYEPWDYTKSEVPIDLDLQKRLYQGFMQAWLTSPRTSQYLAGFSIFEWPVGEGGPDDRTYTPQGKPAEQVLREWFKKPRWDVK